MLVAYVHAMDSLGLMSELTSFTDRDYEARSYT
jgi:hypothetical protein